MPDPILVVAGVSKRFCRNLRRSLRYGAADIAADLMPWRARHAGLRRDEFWALQDVSFTLARGEAMAVVGHNGAGKSTLLRIIAGLFAPDAGEVRINGRVQSVIEIGSGFNPVLSGRENARLILSWQCAGGAQRLAELVEAAGAFAELGALFDAPLQSYSSGMRARLAFALATQLPSDLLLLDEVLAVGDQAFQRKCLAHIRGHLDGGGALLFVSHNVFQIQTVCRRGLLLDHGRVMLDGSSVDAIDRLFEASAAQGGGDSAGLVPDPAMPRIEQLVARAPDGGPIRTGGELELQLDYVLPEPIEASVSLGIWTRDLSVCVAILADPDRQWLPAGAGSRICRVPSLPLVAGTYLLRASIFDPATMHAYAMHGYTSAATPLKVTGETDRLTLLRRNSGQLVMIDASWPDSRDRACT